MRSVDGSVYIELVLDYTKHMRSVDDSVIMN